LLTTTLGTSKVGIEGPKLAQQFIIGIIGLIERGHVVSVLGVRVWGITIDLTHTERERERKKYRN
jgi:hypothetical protein